MDWSEELFQLWLEAAKIAGKSVAYLQRIGQVLEEWRQGKQPSQEAKSAATADISTAKSGGMQPVVSQQPAATDTDVGKANIQPEQTITQKVQVIADQVSSNGPIANTAQNVAQPIPQNSIVNPATVDLNQSATRNFETLNQKPSITDHPGTLNWIASMADELASHPAVGMDEASTLREKARFARVKANEIGNRGRGLLENEAQYFQDIRNNILQKMMDINPEQFASMDVDQADPGINTSDSSAVSLDRISTISETVNQGVQAPSARIDNNTPASSTTHTGRTPSVSEVINQGVPDVFSFDPQSRSSSIEEYRARQAELKTRAEALENNRFNVGDPEAQLTGQYGMHYPMPASQNITGQNTRTLDLIGSGVRRATTRTNWYNESTGKQEIPRPGDIVRFYDKNTGRSQYVHVRDTRHLGQAFQQAGNKGSVLDEFAKAEGWTPEAYRDFYNRGQTVTNDATQVLFDPIDEKGNYSYPHNIDKGWQAGSSSPDTDITTPPTGRNSSTQESTEGLPLASNIIEQGVQSPPQKMPGESLVSYKLRYEDYQDNLRRLRYEKGQERLGGQPGIITKTINQDIDKRWQANSSRSDVGAPSTPDINTVINQGVQPPKSQQPMTQVVSDQPLNLLGSSSTESLQNRLENRIARIGEVRSIPRDAVKPQDLMTQKGIASAIKLLDSRASNTFRFGRNLPVSERDARLALFSQSEMSANEGIQGSQATGNPNIMTAPLGRDLINAGVRQALTGTSSLNPQRIREIKDLAREQYRSPSIVGARKLADLINTQYKYHNSEVNAYADNYKRQLVSEGDPVVSSRFPEMYLPESSGKKLGYGDAGLSANSEERKYRNVDFDKARKVKQPFLLTNPIPLVRPYINKKTGELVTHQDKLFFFNESTSRAGLPGAPRTEQERNQQALEHSFAFDTKILPDGSQVRVPRSFSVDDVIDNIDNGNGTNEFKRIAPNESFNKELASIQEEDLPERQSSFSPHYQEAEGRIGSDPRGKERRLLEQWSRVSKTEGGRLKAQELLGQLDSGKLSYTDYRNNLGKAFNEIQDAGFYPIVGVGNDAGRSDIETGALGRFAGGKQIVLDNKGNVIYKPYQRLLPRQDSFAVVNWQSPITQKFAQQSKEKPFILDSRESILFDRIQNARDNGVYFDAKNPVHIQAVTEERDALSRKISNSQSKRLKLDLIDGLLKNASGSKPFVKVASIGLDPKSVGQYSAITEDIDDYKQVLAAAHPFLSDNPFDDISNQIKSGQLHPNVKRILASHLGNTIPIDYDLDNPDLVKRLDPIAVGDRVDQYHNVLLQLAQKIEEKQGRASRVVQNVLDTPASDGMVNFFAPASTQRDINDHVIAPRATALGFDFNYMGGNSLPGMQAGASSLGISSSSSGKTIGDVANFVKGVKNLGLASDLPDAAKLLGDGVVSYRGTPEITALDEDGGRIALDDNGIVENIPYYDRNISISPAEVKAIQSRPYLSTEDWLRRQWQKKAERLGIDLPETRMNKLLNRYRFGVRPQANFPDLSGYTPSGKSEFVSQLGLPSNNTKFAEYPAYPESRGRFIPKPQQILPGIKPYTQTEGLRSDPSFGQAYDLAPMPMGIPSGTNIIGTDVMLPSTPSRIIPEDRTYVPNPTAKKVMSSGRFVNVDTSGPLLLGDGTIRDVNPYTNFPSGSTYMQATPYSPDGIPMTTRSRTPLQNEVDGLLARVPYHQVRQLKDLVNSGEHRIATDFLTEELGIPATQSSVRQWGLDEARNAATKGDRFYDVATGQIAPKTPYATGDYYRGRPTETGTVLDDLAREAMARDSKVGTSLVPVHALVNFLQDVNQKRRFRY